MGESSAASQAGDADSSRAPGLTSGLQGSPNVQWYPYFWCHSDSASVLLYFTYAYCASEIVEELN